MTSDYVPGDSRRSGSTNERQCVGFAATGPSSRKASESLMHQQTLRPAGTEAGRDDIEPVKHAIAIAILQPANGSAIADQQPPFAIKGNVIAAAG